MKLVIILLIALCMYDVCTIFSYLLYIPYAPTSVTKLVNHN